MMKPSVIEGASLANGFAFCNAPKLVIDLTQPLTRTVLRLNSRMR